MEKIVVPKNRAKKEDYEKLWGQLSGVLKELAALVGK